MKFELVKNQFDREKVSEYVLKLGVPRAIAEILISRNISLENASRFLNPDLNDFSNPFDLSGMEEAVARIQQAIDCQERVVVYGDYDADGICATAILTKYLVSKGVDVFPYTPNRIEGYGLNVETLEMIAENLFPDLILTVDLGISCYEEVEFVKSLGIDIIVSDHHELPEVLPDCITINPKLDHDPRTLDLCGAGVALKIVQALDKSYGEEYLDLATIATIADSVSLVEENRLIAFFGLKMMEKKASMPVRLLLNSLGVKGQVSATTVGFSIAPRLNAAGRMGDAPKALNYLIEENEARAKEILDELHADNLERQKLTEGILSEARKMIVENYAGDRAIVLANDSWHGGLVGIVASRLVEEFHKPVILFSKNDDIYKGSARSIEGINIYDVLSRCKDQFITFGGHKMAAGLSIEPNVLDAFRKRFNAELAEYPLSLFAPRYTFDIDADAVDMDVNFVTKLQMLEPYGVGNPKPITIKRVRNAGFSPLSKPQHISAVCDSVRVVGFSMGASLNALNSNSEKVLFLDYSVEEFRGAREVKAILRKFLITEREYVEDEKSAILYALLTENRAVISHDAFLKEIEDREFGVVLLTETLEGLDSCRSLFNGREYIEEVSNLSRGTNVNRIIFRPEDDIDLSAFPKIYAVGSVNNNVLTRYQNAKTLEGFEDIFPKSSAILFDRETLGRYYKHIVRFEGRKLSELLKSVESGILVQLLYSLAILKELKIVSISDVIIIDHEIRVDLQGSKLYQKLQTRSEA